MTIPRWRAALPGLALAVVLAAGAFALAPLLPLIGAPVLGVLLGLVVALLRGRQRGPAPGPPTKPDPLAPGLKVASSRILQVAVVLLGAQLSLGQIADSGVDALPVLVAVITACLLGAWLLGRALGVERDLCTLLGVGTAICGASAIAAITPVLRPTADKVAYALSTVFACNIAAVLLFPLIGHLVGMSPHTFGIFVGAAVNDTSSVLAAASAFGPEAADTAVVVKLTRTLAIIPIVLGLAVLVARWQRRAALTVDGAGGEGSAASPGTDDGGAPVRPAVWQLVPWFLVGFVVLASANTLGLVPPAAHQPLAVAAAFCITVALCAIGAATDLPGLRRTGPRPMVLGVLLWVLVTGVALATQVATGAFEAG